MPQDLTDSQLKAIWRQGKTPVVFRRGGAHPVLVRVPFAEGNKEWLRDDRRAKPKWNGQYKAWEIPVAWFDRTIRLALRRYREAYVIQVYREQQKCAPACWNAHGFHCECSCMGAHHGKGHPDGAWYEVSQTFAASWGEQRYSCRLLQTKNVNQQDQPSAAAAPGRLSFKELLLSDQARTDGLAPERSHERGNIRRQIETPG